MSALIDDYLADLHRRLPAALVEEATSGLLETYEHHLATGVSDHEAARAALAEFGDLAMVVGEFTRQAPSRRAARLLLATGPVAALFPGDSRYLWSLSRQITVGFNEPAAATLPVSGGLRSLLVLPHRIAALRHQLLPVPVR